MLTGSVNLMPEAPVGQLVELARYAEQLGLARCWVYDEGLATRDVYVTMTAIAGATERILIGPGITNPHTRHVAATATAIATLDEMSGGRAFLGIGAGGSLTLGPLGLSNAAPLTAVREMLIASRSLFSGEPVDMDATRFSLRSASLGFARPDIELWLASRGPKMLALGGELADGVFLDFLHRDVVADTVAIVTAGGRRPKLTYSTMLVTEGHGIEHVKPHVTYRLVDSQPKVRELLGISDAEIDQIRQAMSGGLEHAAQFIKDEWVEPFVLTGTPAECGRQLAHLMSTHGFDEFLLPILELDSAADLMATLAEVLRAG